MWHESKKIYRILKTLNVISAIVIAFLAVYIVLQPFLPNIILAMSYNKFQGYAFNSQKTFEVLGESAKELPQIPNENRIVIPKIYVNAEVHEGEDISTLNLGMWHRPNSSTPDIGGNTVITAHRFLHTTGPETFYHLDKVEMNDEVLIYWQGKEFVYKVYEITEVYPEQIEIENNTKDPIITLYTCEPLWTSEKRLVVKARLQ